MSKKRNQAVIMVAYGMTVAESANFKAAIEKVKPIHAPHARVVVTSGERRDVGKYLEKSHDKIKKLGVN
jgi:hypothetical protein